MIGLNMGFLTESHDRQHGGDRPPSRGEDGTREEDFDVLPYRSGKDRRKDRDDGKELDRQREDSYPFIVTRGVPSLLIDCHSNHYQ